MPTMKKTVYLCDAEQTVRLIMIFTGHGPMEVLGFRLICGNIIYIRVIKPS